MKGCNGDNNNNNRELQICDKITKEQLPWKNYQLYLIIEQEERRKINN